MFVTTLGYPSLNPKAYYVFVGGFFHSSFVSQDEANAQAAKLRKYEGIISPGDVYGHTLLYRLDEEKAGYRVIIDEVTMLPDIHKDEKQAAELICKLIGNRKLIERALRPIEENNSFDSMAP